MFVEGRVTDLQGNGVAGCTIETWETDEDGLYDTRTSAPGSSCFLHPSALHDARIAVQQSSIIRSPLSDRVRGSLAARLPRTFDDRQGAPSSFPVAAWRRGLTLLTYLTQDGYYSYRCILPVAYPIPNDGPVGQFLRKLNRHVFRPAHLHMQFEVSY